MSVVDQAIWFAESNLTQETTLADIAKRCRVTPEHLTRSFANETGKSFIEYMRGRRLTLAANALLKRPTDILKVAIELGYGSHEAFTRAFKAHFGFPPSEIREHPDVVRTKSVAPLRMIETVLEHAPPFRRVKCDSMRVAGLCRSYTDETAANIPHQWIEFHSTPWTFPEKTPGVTYGVCREFDDHMDYMCAVETEGQPDLPEGFECWNLEPQTYAVFEHVGHISEIRRTWKTIFMMHFNNADFHPVSAPSFERYGPGLKPCIGVGDTEIWIPVKP